MKYWFKRKRYGYGWTPTTYQGWVALLAYTVALLVGTISIIGTQENPGTVRVVGGFILMLGLTLLLLKLTSSKGPKAKWRWGKKEDDTAEEDW